MARARGANAVMALAFESTYGTPPGSGYNKVPFVTANLGEEQGLVASDLLGYGRDPQVASEDVITDEGDVVVPLDLRNSAFWFKALFGAPTTTQGVAAKGSWTFSGQPEDGATITIGTTDWTFVASSPSGNESLIASSLEQTLANAVLGLNASATAGLAAATYSLNIDGKTIDIVYDTIGTSGNSIALDASSSSPDSNATPSAATLEGGSASGPYNHVFTSGALALPSLAVEIGLPDAGSYGMNYGAAVDKLAISLARSGHLNMTLSLIAQGESRAGSSAAGSPTEKVLERFTQFTGKILRDGVPFADLVSGTFNYMNGMDKVEVIRGDGRIGGVDPGPLSVTGENVMRFKDSTYFDLASSRTAIEVRHSWKIADGKELTIITHYVQLPRPKLPITGPGGIQASYAWQAAEHPTLHKTVTATLVNDVSAY